MGEKLQLHLEKEQYTELAARYHFADTDLELLMRIGALAEQAAQPVMYFGRIEQEARMKPGKRLAVIVSLGGGIDALQDSYMQQERLTESYMIECITMELLRTAYEKAAKRIHEITGMWLSSPEFVGDRTPLSDIKEIWQLLRPVEISYNQAYMMNPKKTVVYYVNQCADRQEHYCSICADCGNLSCAGRDTSAS